MTFPNSKSVAVYHLPSTGTKSYPASPSLTIDAGLLPMNRMAHSLEGGSYSNAHELYTDPGDDVRVSDKLVIDGETYYVRQAFKAPFGTNAHNRYSISTEAE